MIIKGVNPLPAHGRAGARATLLAAHSPKANTKFGGGGTPEAERFAFATGQEARASKNSFPLTPFPRTRTSSVRDFAFCPPERKSFSKFSVGIFAEKSSDFVQDRQLVYAPKVTRVPRVSQCFLPKRYFQKRGL